MTTNKSNYALDLLNSSVTTLPPPADSIFYVKNLEKEDPVNHPKHYTVDPSGIECIQITRHRNFNIGNAIKYLWRAGLKESNSDIQDLEKAIWYITDEIKRLKGEYNK